MFILKMFSRLFHYLHIQDELWHHSWPLKMLADYTTRPDTQERRRVGYSVICTCTTLTTIRESSKLHNWGRIRDTSRQTFNSTTSSPSPVRCCVSSMGRGDNWSLWLHPPHLFPKCWMLAWCEVFCAACLAVMIYIFFKYHLVIPSMWLLSPCLILMEKDILAMWKRKEIDKAYQHWQYLPFSWHTKLDIKCYRQNISQNVLFLKPAHFLLKKQALRN